MRVLFLVMFCFLGLAHAKFPRIDVVNVNGNYYEGAGHASAQKAFYVLPKARIFHENIDIRFNKKESNLVISDPSTEVTLDFDFSFLNIFKAFSFNNLGIKSTDKLFTIRSDDMNLHISPTVYHMENFLVETDVRNIPVGDDDDITIVDGLILNAALSFKTLEFQDFDNEFFNDLKDENHNNKVQIEQILEKRQKWMLPMIVRFLKFNVKDGRFYGKTLIDSYINLWLRLDGKVKSNKENTKIEIHLQRAKLGIFSIRGTLMNMVRRLKLNGVQVKGHYIYVNLEKINS
jgi:hypothetical protein